MARYAIILGIISVIGPLAIDMYLPAFPAIAKSMRVDPARVQLSMVSYFLAFSVGQLVYGPISDRFGRKTPLVASYAIYFVASVGAALFVRIEGLIAMRFLQGIGACAGLVIGRSITRDLGSGPYVVRLFAMMTMVIGVSPILAPSLGSALLVVFPWTSIFWFMAGFSLLCLALILVGLPETLPPARRASHLGLAFWAYARLLRDRRFLALILVGSFAQAGFFIYLSGSPFVLMSLHGLGPRAYAIAFAVNAIALVGGAQVAVPLMRMMPAERSVILITAIYGAIAVALLAAALAGRDSLALTLAALFLMVGCLGTINPITQMMAIEEQAAQAGAASALIGACQFGVGAVAAAALSAFDLRSASPMALLIAVCAGLALLAALVSRRAAD